MSSSTTNLNCRSLRPTVWMAALVFASVVASSSHAGTVVSSISTTGSILNSFTAGSYTFTTSDLIQPTMTTFAGSNNTNFVTPLSGGLPSGAARSELLTHDFDLRTGVINAAAAATSVTLTFPSPLINGPGPDLVAFEFDLASPPDGFTVIANSTTVSYAGTDYNTDLGNVGTFFGYTRNAGTPTTLSQLQNDPYMVAGSPTSQNIYGIAIDLDEFGVPAFGSISSLTYGGGSGQWDPVLFQGINSVPIPEPSSMMLLGLGVVGLALRRRRDSNAAARQFLPSKSKHPGTES